ncbi:MAG: DNA polymerase III subunit beta [Desulfohalobiaceae bacterium]|nr:DNA polymerase III subunit beta [Desulfohalobiaceae bacterium]
MKAKIKKENTIEGVSKATSIIPVRTGAAFLRTLWLETKEDRLKIMSTDSKIEFSGEYKAGTLEEGLVGVQGRSFYDLYRRLPTGEITLSQDDGQNVLLLKQGRRKYKLPTHDPSWFQTFSPFPEENAIEWTASHLRELIEHISFCIADDDSDTMFYMKMVPVQEEGYIEVCGLNGHQFGMQRFIHPGLQPLLGEEGVLIPKPYLMELKKWLTQEEILLNIDQKRIFVTNKQRSETLSFPISFDKFPNYNIFLSYFENPTSRLILDREELIDSLERIYLFNSETQRCCYFVFSDQELVLYSQGQDTGEGTESIEINYQGDIEQIIFPTKNLIEILTHFKSPYVQLEFTDQNGPCKITGEKDPDYLVIIMPVKVEEETYYTEEEIESEL